MKKILLNLLIINSMMGITIDAHSYSCHVDEGLRLLNTVKPPLDKIKKILNHCGYYTTADGQVELLRGLLARKEGQLTSDYKLAIYWLEQARRNAEASNSVPALELAVTYEWADQPVKAQTIYKQVLAKEVNSRAALLGLARTLVMQNNIDSAFSIYQKFLSLNPNDADALNGMAMGYVVNRDYSKALENYRKVLKINNTNSEALAGIQRVYIILTKTARPAPASVCEANQGLALLNTNQPPYPKIAAILKTCDVNSENDVQVLLLHGLVERKKAIKTRKFNSAISWLKKAEAVANKDNLSPALELAVTYEWAQQANNAKQIYTDVLAKYPNSKPALLGLARIALFNKDYTGSINYYNQVLKLYPNDPDAMAGLKQVEAAKKNQKKNKPVVVNCHANQGLELLNQPNPNYAKITGVLRQCDKYAPNDVQTLLLHGLLARKEGQITHDYRDAIYWLQRAQAVAPKGDLSPSLELAVTYEWNDEPAKAQRIYSSVIWNHPDNQAAALGTARVYIAYYQPQLAERIYRHLLQINPENIDALVGMGRANLVDNEFSTSRNAYNRALMLDPGNKEALTGLNLLDNTTRYILGISGGRYTLNNDKSTIGHMGFYGNINATDQIILEYTHNSNQLGLGFVLDPGPLPKNDVTIGFHRQYPYRYGWGMFYEYRERTNFPLENRVEVNGNVFLSKRLKLFVGMRDGWGTALWKNQLYYSGATLFTDRPFNVTLTGFWGVQEVGGNTSTYAVDFSKEFSNNAYYVIGTAYSPSQLSWEVHTRVIIPLTKNHALEGGYERFYFNNAIAYSLGWRFYW